MAAGGLRPGDRRISLLPEFIDANTATGQFVLARDRYVDP